MRRVDELVTPLAQLPRGTEHAVEGAHRAEVDAFVEQLRIRRVGRDVDKAWAVERLQDLLALGCREHAGRTTRRARRRYQVAGAAAKARSAVRVGMAGSSSATALMIRSRHSRAPLPSEAPTACRVFFALR